MITMIPAMDNLKCLSDEELVELRWYDGQNGWVNANLLNEIGRREALRRKPGDLGTMENPIIRDGKAFVYTMYNHLALWEDWPGEGTTG